MTKSKLQNAGIGISRIKWAYVIISGFLLALGVCTFIWPEITAGAVCSAIGAASIVFGIIRILAYFMREIKGVGLNYDFSIGLLAVIAGLALLIGKDRVVDLLQVVIGIYLVIDSVFKLQTALDTKRLGIPGWWLSLIVTAACLGLGVTLIVKTGTSLLMGLIGAALIADGLQNLFLVIFSAVAAKTLARREKDAETETPDGAQPQTPPESTASAPADAEPGSPKPAEAPTPETQTIKD